VCVFNFKKSLLDYGFDPLLVEEWLAIRKTKKAINSEFSFNSFISQIEKSGAEKNEVLRTIAEKQWAGFNHAWMKKTNNNLNSFENETDRRARESAKRKQEIYEYARSVGMVSSEEKRDIVELW
jgi:ppGpp synthetase/RelA/SpoT-type nucleotidyltranferase